MSLLKVVENQVTHGVPAHSSELIDMQLQQIVDAGKITNPYQLFALGRCAAFFKNGLKSADLQMENPVNFESGETSTATKEGLKAMSDDEHVALAKYLLDCIVAGESALHKRDLSIVSWINFVLRKQD